MSQRDDIYRSSTAQIVDFAFTEEVAAVFPDMIRRSVTGYETIIPVTGLIAARHLGEAGTAYDLGCSLGATTLAILSQSEARDIRIVGVDSSLPMIKGAQENITDPRAQFIHQDLRDTPLSDAKVVILNLVLQFIAPEHRLQVISRIRSEMRNDGLLILTEKVRHEDTWLHQFYDDTHMAWKRANGYTEMEVSGKRNALENVMKIDTEATHTERLAEAGFGRVLQWYRCLNWTSFLAFADDAR